MRTQRMAIVLAGVAGMVAGSSAAWGQVVAISREITVYGAPAELVATAGVVAISREPTVQGYPCAADQDDGGAGGRSDGGVTIEDLLYFLARYEEGSAQADLDDGNGHGVPDGGVTIEDLLYFLTHYFAGC